MPFCPRPEPQNSTENNVKTRESSIPVLRLKRSFMAVNTACTRYNQRFGRILHKAMIQTLFGTPQPSFLDKMKQAVTRTRENLSERIDEVMALTKEIDRGTLDDLEGILLGADLGTKTTEEILSKLREKADRKQIKDAA